MESCRIAIAKAGYPGNWSPSLTIIRSAFSIPTVNRLSKALIYLKSFDVMELVLSFAWRILAFFSIRLLLTIFCRWCLYFTTLFVFVDWSVRDDAFEIEAWEFFKKSRKRRSTNFPRWSEVVTSLKEVISLRSMKVDMYSVANKNQCDGAHLSRCLELCIVYVPHRWYQLVWLRCRSWETPLL